MEQYVPGQRWICDTELHMGLGIVTEVAFRTITIDFQAVGERRTYAKETAPLTRVVFNSGDTIRSQEGWSFSVTGSTSQQGLITYSGSLEDGSQAILKEGQIDNFIQLNRPAERLFSGQIDPDKWFDLRYQTLQINNRLAHSEVRGLVGGRTSLIPHQLYIAHEVANRYAPRVLLADEVGLGKTIEAGMILHHQLLTERARRVLIVVPESLVYQWLVEMLRRFNLHFSIFDAQRCQAMEENGDPGNPFQSEQLVLCSLDFLATEPQYLQLALEGDWDLLVVDEAHHLQWSPTEASPEYLLIKALAATTKGVLLLTATPEQLGKASHFARLHLLDPDRFPDFESFVAEENAYIPIATAIETLLSGQQLGEEEFRTLTTLLQEEHDQKMLQAMQSARAADTVDNALTTALVEQLLDRHGTGRVLFRNTRATVKGFPQRVLTPHPLPLPKEYAEALSQMPGKDAIPPHLLLCPERLYQTAAAAKHQHWTQFDPRVDWLMDTLKQLKPQKVLVIAAKARTVLELAQALKQKAGIHAAVFHEGMSIIERDRAAVYFAGQENGSQVMLCSEIGSEGRNFQFAQHLVLFDLPYNPDLLEQRIGRLDRIGQSQTIHIHVPYLQHSAQDKLFHWYHEGLAAFEHTCPIGHNVFTEIGTSLQSALQDGDTDSAEFASLIESTQQLRQQLTTAMHQGRDRLLEYNSCRMDIANRIKTAIGEIDADPELLDYLGKVFDCYGVDLEDHSEDCYIARPSDNMQVSSFPALPEDGMTLTFSRATALSFEDAQFLSWEHPMLTGALDMVLNDVHGNTALIAIKHKGTAAGAIYLECLFRLETIAASDLQTTRYLPPTSIRVVIGQDDKNYAQALGHALLNNARIRVDTETAKQVIAAKEQEIRGMLKKATSLAEAKAPAIVDKASSRAETMLRSEITRLQALQAVNPNIRAEEIAFFERQLEALGKAIEASSINLDAVRVIVAT